MADNLVEAWCRGLVAGCDDPPTRANPYPAGTELADTWSDGWREGAHRRNQPLPGEADGLDAGGPDDTATYH